MCGLLFHGSQPSPSTAPLLNEKLGEAMKGMGVDLSPSEQLTPGFARQLAPLLDHASPVISPEQPRHSNAVVVVDREGNICVMTHTINAVVWGGAGLVVGGIPLPDSAGFQQARLALVKPGSRLRHEIVDTIVLKKGKPVFATASIGSSLSAETLRILISCIAQQQNLKDVMSAPPQLMVFESAPLDGGDSSLPVLVPEGAYPGEFLESAKTRGLAITQLPKASVDALRGTVVSVSIEPDKGECVSVEQPDIMVFHQTPSRGRLIQSPNTTN